MYKGLGKNGKIVAIKQILRHNLSNTDLRNIQSEIELLKKLKHPHIVKYIDFISTKSHLNIILEYVESGSLSHLVKNLGTFEEGLTAFYTKQVLKGLRYLHN